MLFRSQTTHTQHEVLLRLVQEGTVPFRGEPLSPRAALRSPQAVHRFQAHQADAGRPGPSLLQLPIWIRVEDEYICIDGLAQLTLACKIAAAYHNAFVSNAPLHDGWDEDTLEMECRAAGFVPDEVSVKYNESCGAALV